jgi:uncharacterized membrane protein
MNPVFKVYLADLEGALSRLQPEQRQDALREIESHFADATAAGASPNDLIARLGPPRLLGAALIAEGLEHSLEAAPLRVWHVIGSSLFIAGTSFTSVLVVPLLAAVAIGFGFFAVFSPIAGLLRTFGATWIQIGNVGNGQSLPNEWSIPFTLGVALVCAGVAFGAYKLLRLYLGLVGRGYRALLSTRSDSPA